MPKTVAQHTLVSVLLRVLFCIVGYQKKAHWFLTLLETSRWSSEDPLSVPSVHTSSLLLGTPVVSPTPGSDH